MAGSTDSSSGARDFFPRTAWFVIAGLVVFRLFHLIPFTARFDLAGDESYYWEWGRRLDWGYYSKPPMIGWLMALVGRMSHDGEWGVRLAALVLGTGSLLLLHRLAEAMYGARVALLALVLAALTPAIVSESGASMIASPSCAPNIQ